jgi:hypothetical protein
MIASIFTDPQRAPGTGVRPDRKENRAIGPISMGEARWLKILSGGREMARGLQVFEKNRKKSKT